MDSLVARTYLVPTLLLLAAAFFVRFYPFAGQVFPLNDGALFLAFVEHIHSGAYFSEPCVLYNGDCVPFAYPPLSFFAASTLLWLGLSPVQVAVVYPLCLSVLLVVVTLWFLREVIEDDFVFLLAAAAALLQVRSIEYLLMGGGISRSTGALFFLLALIGAVRAAAGTRTRPAVLGGVCAGLALLSHLEWGINAAVGASLVVLFSARTGPQKARLILLAALCATLVVAPWAIWALSTHGAAPFRSAGDTANWSLGAALAASARLDFFQPAHLAWLAVIGSVALWLRGQTLWLTMLVVFFFLTPRHFGSVAVYPTAILLAYGIASLLSWVSRLGARALPPAGPGAAARGEVIALLAVITVLFVGLFDRSGQVAGLRKLSPDVRAAATLAAGRFPEGAVAAILTDDPWYLSKDAEWWPYLSDHRVLNTVQGSEWLDRGEFRARERVARNLRTNPDCPSLRARLEALGPPDYVVDVAARACVDEFGPPIFEAPDVTVFAFDRSQPG